jgi:hypothetical protein
MVTPTHDRRAVPPLALVALLLTLSTGSLAAQDRQPYLGASIGTHHTSADLVDGRLGNGGVHAGIALLPWMDIEGEWQHPTGTIRRERTGTSLSFAPPGSARDEIERLSVVTRFASERRAGALLSVGVNFRPRLDAAQRIRPQFFIGLTGHWVEDVTVLDHLVLPPGVTREQLERAMPPQEPWRRNLGGVTLGASLAIAVTPRWSIVPDLRYDYGSIGDEINNALRPSLRVQWRSLR